MARWPEQQARGWRRSWWIQLTLVPLALLSWAGFLYAGARQKRRFAAAGPYAVGMVVGLVLAHDAPDSGARDDPAG